MCRKEHLIVGVMSARWRWQLDTSLFLSLFWFLGVFAAGWSKRDRSVSRSQGEHAHWDGVPVTRAAINRCFLQN